jgi:hypothetical protein
MTYLARVAAVCSGLVLSIFSSTSYDCVLLNAHLDANEVDDTLFAASNESGAAILPPLSSSFPLS